MLFGYTPFDPLVVLGSTAYTVYLLSRNPVRLIGWMPAALSFYFFMPFITLLTLWQVVLLILTGRAFFQLRLRAAPFAQPVFLVVFLAFVMSSIYGVFVGLDGTRAAIRILYYLGLFALMSFAYEMGRRPDCLQVLLKGLALTGVVLAVYGLYQIVAIQVGLPVRGIVRGTQGAQMAFENGILRINSFASEPKRLGYILFLGALACVFWARLQPQHGRRLWLAALGIFAMSLFTFAASYFAAVFLFVCAAVLLYPSRATIYFFGLLVMGAMAMVVFPDLGIYESLEHGYERRLEEVETGLDGQRVYRQEFFAQDYLARHPLAAIFGVGLGQYFVTLYQEYGVGVGFNGYGGLVPMNSTFLELVLDLGGAVAVLFYLAIAALIWQLRRAGEHFLCLALLFVTVQSLTILTVPFMVFFGGLGTARLVVRRQERRDRSQRFYMRSTALRPAAYPRTPS